MAVFLVFIFWITPLQHGLTNVLRNTWVVSQEVKESFGVVGVTFCYLLAFLVACLRVVPVFSYHICRETAAIVYISFVVWHHAPINGVVNSFPRVYFLNPYQQFVMAGVVILGLCYFYAVCRVVGQCYTIVVGLYLFVSGALFSHFFG